jgi:tetratricopeptide (TPR) repeat protein
VEAALAGELTPQQRATALAEQGQLLLAEGKADEAVVALTEAAELAPAEDAIHLALAKALSLTGQADQARHHSGLVQKLKACEDRMDQITRDLIDAPNDSDLRCEAGSIFIEIGLKREAVGWLMSALRCDPGHPKAAQLLLDYGRETGDAALAARVHLIRGRGLLRQGQLFEALDEFGYAKDHPDTAAAALLLSGEALYKAGRYADAQRILALALQRDPNLIDAHRWLAATYHDVGAMDDAQQELQWIAQRAPDDPRPHRLMGLIYKDYEAYPKAIEAYRESLRRDPDQPDEEAILLEMAECLVKERRHSEALKALGACPKSARRLALEAECRYAQGDKRAARKLVDQAIALQPDHLGALQLAASLDLESNDAESAVRILRQAVEHHPREFRVRYGLAQAYKRLGQMEEAQEELKIVGELRALSRRFTDLHQQADLQPANAQVRYELGVVARQLDKPKLARTWFTAAVGLDPQHKEARQALDALTPPPAETGPKKDEPGPPPDETPLPPLPPLVLEETGSEGKGPADQGASHSEDAAPPAD